VPPLPGAPTPLLAAYWLAAATLVAAVADAIVMLGGGP
jgi:hypothetical protein